MIKFTLKRTLRALLGLLVVSCALLPLVLVSAQDKAALAHAVAVITPKTAQPLHLDVEIAATQEQQERGLMFRRDLPADKGMLFPYDPPREVAFWMKNTVIPLDILFIGPEGRIVKMVEAQPLDQTPLPSGQPVKAVLEIKGGLAASAGLATGDQVVLER